jgi:hypothetical protein
VGRETDRNDFRYVIAGLDPAIHDEVLRMPAVRMDCRQASLRSLPEVGCWPGNDRWRVLRKQQILSFRKLRSSYPESRPTCECLWIPGSRTQVGLAQLAKERSRKNYEAVWVSQGNPDRPAPKIAPGGHLADQTSSSLNRAKSKPKREITRAFAPSPSQ